MNSSICFGGGLALLVFVACVNCTVAQAQSSTTKGFTPAATAATQQSGVALAAAKKALPYKPSVRVHLEKGANKGYLVLQVDLAAGHHLYSLNPKGSPAPTKIVVSPSNDMNVLGAFTSDKQPLVIEKDPIFNRRIEKHKGVVQFFAPIEVRPGIDLSKFTTEVTFSGQVCSDSACRQIKAQKVTGKFASFFDPPKATTEKPTATTAQQPAIPSGTAR